jgi:hypothetical protein
MDSDIRTGGNGPIDHNRLRFITENLAALQGLDAVALGAMLFFLELKDVLKDPWWLYVLNLAAVVVIVRQMPSKYYERHFGRVEPKSKNPTSRREAVRGLVGILLLIVALIWGRRIEVWVDAVLMGDQSGQIRWLAALMWSARLFRNTQKESPADPRGPSFYVVGLITSTAVCFYPKLYPEVMQSLIWKTLNAGSLGLSLIAWGLRDHLLLVHLLPKNGSDDEDEWSGNV